MDDSLSRFGGGIELRAPNLVLTEGKTDAALIDYLNTRQDIQVLSYSGKDNLANTIRALMLVRNYSEVRKAAIARDCDSSPERAFSSAISHWKTAHSVESGAAAPDEWFSSPDGRQWSIWLIPSPQEPGALEDLLWQAVPQTSHALCIEELMDCLRAVQDAEPGSSAKARFYSWLATQKQPVTSIAAVLKRERDVISFDHPAFDRLKSLLNSM